ncbi:MAG: hypothetical protein ACO1QR_16810, partial [Chthoniobacteraceae bacterium]
MSPMAVESGRRWLFRGALVFIGVAIGIGLGATVFTDDARTTAGTGAATSNGTSGDPKFRGPLTPSTAAKRADKASIAPASPGVVSFEAELHVSLGDVVDSRRAASVQMAAQKLTLADVAQAFERAQTLPARDRYMVVNAIATRWAELDPVAAAAGAMALADASRRQSALVAGAQRWAVDAPEEACQWLSANVSARQQQMVFNGLLNAVARS